MKLGIVLGAQVLKQISGESVPSQHLWLRLLGAVEAYRNDSVTHFIVSGGHNFGIRYAGETILQSPDFSFQALSDSQDKPSEAAIMKDFLILKDIPANHILMEDLSATTRENAQFIKILLQRTPAFDDLELPIRVMTNVYHIEQGALQAFEEVGLPVSPLAIEDCLIGTPREDKIMEYYRGRRDRLNSDFPNLEELAVIITERRSVMELL